MYCKRDNISTICNSINPDIRLEQLQQKEDKYSGYNQSMTAVPKHTSLFCFSTHSFTTKINGLIALNFFYTKTVSLNSHKESLQSRKLRTCQA